MLAVHAPRPKQRMVGVRRDGLASGRSYILVAQQSFRLWERPTNNRPENVIRGWFNRDCHDLPFLP